MKITFLSILLLITVGACSFFNNKYYVRSPNKDKTLVFKWVNSLNPNKRWYVKIYQKGSADNYVAIRSMLDFPIALFWGDTIKIRGGIFVKGDTLNRMINWKEDYTKKEAEEIMKDTVNWKHYFLNKIPEGADK
jgi:hypothetical protein